MSVWELLPVAAPVRVEHAVDTLRYADSAVPIGIKAPIGAPDTYRAAHQFMCAGESRAWE